jgi:hypothetical protein
MTNRTLPTRGWKTGFPKLNTLAYLTATAISIWICVRAPAADIHALTICPGDFVDLAVDPVSTRDLVCEAATHAVRLLTGCEILPRGRLHIEISPSVRGLFGSEIFGRFDVSSEVTFVTSYEKAGMLAAGTPYSVIPHADFYRSLVVHEVVHAILGQNQKRRPSSRSAVEYPAYALQLVSMPKKVREDFLNAVDAKATSVPLLFNDILLAFDPFYFAARAYDHFTTSSDGCANIREVLKGDASFIATIL